MVTKFLNIIRNSVLYSLFFILTLTVLSLVGEAKDYKGIRPLKTTRAELEQRFGKPDKGIYKIDGQIVTIYYVDTYYKEPCHNKNNCDCLVSPDTVIKIRVYIPYELKLKQLNLPLSHYKKTVNTHLTSYVTYSNFDEGIVYEVWEEDETIKSITYLPSSKDCESLLEMNK